MLAGLPAATEKRWLLSLDRLEITRHEVQVSTASQVSKRSSRPTPGKQDLYSSFERGLGWGTWIPQVPPLRCAPVGMTEERKCFQLRLVVDVATGIDEVTHPS